MKKLKAKSSPGKILIKLLSAFWVKKKSHELNSQFSPKKIFYNNLPPQKQYFKLLVSPHPY
jgi:hypothetical protein